jgi:PAC2 family
VTFARRQIDVEPPEHPVFVIALDGWIDAGFAAATALAAIVSDIDSRTYVTFDPDELIDQRARRPRLRVDDGVRTSISWPEPAIVVGRDRMGTGVALLIGPEPDYRWKPFTEEVVGLAKDLGARIAVGIGAFPIAAPHTRPINLISTASKPELTRSVGFMHGSVDVPAGIGEVIGHACDEAGIPSVGLWARVPHYVAAMPFAPAALALVEGLCEVGGLVLGSDALHESAEEACRQVDELIAQSEEHKAMVKELEEQFDAGAEPISGFEGESLPTGDEIAAELERYLRGETG